MTAADPNVIREALLDARNFFAGMPTDDVREVCDAALAALDALERRIADLDKYGRIETEDEYFAALAALRADLAEAQRALGANQQLIRELEDVERRDNHLRRLADEECNRADAMFERAEAAEAALAEAREALRKIANGLMFDPGPSKVDELRAIARAALSAADKTAERE